MQHDGTPISIKPIGEHSRGRAGKLVAALPVALLLTGGLLAGLSIWAVQANAPSGQAAKEAAALAQMPWFEKADSFITPDGFVWMPDRLTIDAVGNGGALEIWNTRTGQLVRSGPPDSDYNSNYIDLLLSPAHSMVAAGTFSSTIGPDARPNTGTVRLLDSSTGQVRRTPAVALPPGYPVKSPKNHPFGFYSFESSVLGWAYGGDNLVSLTVMGGEIKQKAGSYGVISSDEGPFYTTAQVWDVGSESLVREITLDRPELRTGPPIDVRDVELSPDGHILAALSESYLPDGSGVTQVDLWDVDTGNLLHSLPRSDPGYGYGEVPARDHTLSWSPDSRTIAVMSGRTVKLLDASKGQHIRSLPDVVPPTYTAAPTMPVIPRLPIIPPLPTTGGIPHGGIPQAQGTARLPSPLPSWPPTPMPPTATLIPLPPPTPSVGTVEPVIGVAWSPDGRTLLTYDDKAIRSWNPATGALNWAVGRYGRASQSGPIVSWSNDARLIASVETVGAYDLERVVLRDTSNGQALRQLTPALDTIVPWLKSTDMISADWVQWSPYSTDLAIGYADNAHELEIWGATSPVSTTP